MSAAFDFYVAGRSWLHRLDPRVKMLLVFVISMVLFFWLNIPLLVAVLLGLQLTLLSIGYPWRKLWLIWRAIFPLLITIIIIWPLFDKAGAFLFSIGPVNIHEGGLLRGFANAARIGAINFVFILWVGTTSPRELVRGFVRLGLPFRWGTALTIGLRFIPTFARTFMTVSDAQQARGLLLEGWWLAKARKMLPVFVAALVSALRASEQLAMTLEARGFGAFPHRTTLHDIAMRPTDWIWTAVLVLGGGVMIWLTLAQGFGRALLDLWS